MSASNPSNHSDAYEQRPPDYAYSVHELDVRPTDGRGWRTPEPQTAPEPAMNPAPEKNPAPEALQRSVSSASALPPPPYAEVYGAIEISEEGLDTQAQITGTYARVPRWQASS